MSVQPYASQMQSLFTPSKEIKASKGVCRGLALSPKITTRFNTIAPPIDKKSPSVAARPRRKKLTRGKSMLMIFALPNKQLQMRVGL